MNGFTALQLANEYGSKDAQNSLYNPTTGYYALTSSTAKSIQTDQSIDNVSRQELLDQLNNGDTDIFHTGDVANAQIAKVNAQLQVDSGNDPLYVGRRDIQDKEQAIIDQPGRRQTALTQTDTTPAGTQTLLTATTPTAGPTTPTGGP